MSRLLRVQRRPLPFEVQRTQRRLPAEGNGLSGWNSYVNRRVPHMPQIDVRDETADGVSSWRRGDECRAPRHFLRWIPVDADLGLIKVQQEIERIELRLHADAGVLPLVGGWAPHGSGR